MKYQMLFLVLLAGCCSSPRIERETKYEIVHDTVKVFVPADVQFDTVFISEQEGENERYIVKVDTLKVLIKGKERIVYVPRIDTVKIVHETIVEKGFFDGITLRQIFIGSFVILMIGIVFGILRYFGVFNR